MVNFVCLAASLLLTAGVGSGYVSSPSRHNAPQLVDNVLYCGFDDVWIDRFEDEWDLIDIDLFSAGSHAWSYVYGGVSHSVILTFADDDSGFLLFDPVHLDYSLVHIDDLFSDGALVPCTLYVNPVAYSPLNLDMLPYFSEYGGYLVTGFGIAHDSGSYHYSPYAVSFNSVDLQTSEVSYVPYYDGTDVTDAITDGLGAIVPMGGALVTGFDAIALDDGALTPVVTFGFVLMGLGISVGIVKKCFNWVTGRHGM